MWNTVANRRKQRVASGRVLRGVQVSDAMSGVPAVSKQRKYGCTSTPSTQNPALQKTELIQSVYTSFPHPNAFNTIESLIGDAFEDLPLPPRQMSLVWHNLSLIFTKTQNIEKHQENELSRLQLDALITSTLDGLAEYSPVDLCRTTIAMAKIIRRIQHRSHNESSHHQDFHHLLVGPSMKRKDEIFTAIATAAVQFLPRFNQETVFNPQSYSNLAYACAIARVKPTYGERTLLDCIADNIVSLEDLASFKPQNLSILVWSYAKAGVPHIGLFNKVAHEVIDCRELNSFDPQHMSNIVWSYATSGISNYDLFEIVADEITRRDLRTFKPQELSNIVWSFTKAEVHSPTLFDKVADEITRRDLSTFQPQDMSIIVHAFAKAGVSHTSLFQRVVDEITQRDLVAFKPQEMSNIVWAYAKAGVCMPALFNQVADEIIRRGLDSFIPQELSNILVAFVLVKIGRPSLFAMIESAIIKRKHELSSQDTANILWAYATCGRLNSPLFETLVPRVKELLRQFNSQGLANITWSYVVANKHVPSLFDKQFIDVVCDNIDSFTNAGLSQLYQWHLWQQKEKFNAALPPPMAQKCYDAFTSQKLNGSVLEMDVIDTLHSMGLQVKKVKRMTSGYSLDTTVKVDGRKVGIEVDGPSHFIDKVPTGNTLLKRRQITTVDKMTLVSIPYWEWDELGKDDKKRQRYIRSILSRRALKACIVL